MQKKRLVTIVVLPLVLFAGVSTARAQSSNIFFKGHGISSTQGADLTIYASFTTDGIVRGEAVLANSMQGDVVELVPQSGNIWCIKQLIESSPGSTWIWLISDLPGGDQLGYDNVSGHSCANASLTLPPEAIDSGGFTGQIVPDTCASDLAACNAQNASLQTQLGQCQSDLNQCNSDLTTCQSQSSQCSLPVLPANYFAKLTGSAFDPDLNTKVKVSAKRDIGGVMKGIIKVNGSWTADVDQLNAPSGSKLDWCVRGTILTSPLNPGQVGSNLILFVRNTGKGCDLLSYTVGTGLDCNTAVPTQPFVSTLPGDFKEGKIRCGDNQCCPS
jgi:hypothetical protein